MTQIAHLSDLHLLEPDHADRRGEARRRLAYLTVGRPNGAARRRRRTVSVLAAAGRSGADHVLVTGDLTEDGIPPQFEILAEVLAESRLPPSRVTLVPGNHDAYVDGGAFERALRGPLAAYAATSTPGVPVFLRDVAILPMCTAVPQPYTRSAGVFDCRELAAAARMAEQSRLTGRALVLAMHHSPRRALAAACGGSTGSRSTPPVGEILGAPRLHVHVLHGHTHTSDRSRGPPRRDAPHLLGRGAWSTAARPSASTTRATGGSGRPRLTHPGHARAGARAGLTPVLPREAGISRSSGAPLLLNRAMEHDTRSCCGRPSFEVGMPHRGRCWSSTTTPTFDRPLALRAVRGRPTSRLLRPRTGRRPWPYSPRPSGSPASSSSI